MLGVINSERNKAIGRARELVLRVYALAQQDRYLSLDMTELASEEAIAQLRALDVEAGAISEYRVSSWYADYLGSTGGIDLIVTRGGRPGEETVTFGSGRIWSVKRKDSKSPFDPSAAN